MRYGGCYVVLLNQRTDDNVSNFAESLFQTRSCIIIKYKKTTEVRFLQRTMISVFLYAVIGIEKQRINSIPERINFSIYLPNGKKRLLLESKG